MWKFRVADFKTVQQIADWRLCQGCGLCAFICPEHKIGLVDLVEEGIRPVVANEECGSCRLCLDVCPAFESDHSRLNSRPGLLNEVKASCGPVLEIWEGHATDGAIRLAGASGGLITALSLYCLEREGMHGVLHIGQDPEDPLKNRTGMSRSRQDLLARTGSRYSPASACDSLHLIEEAPAPCVFVGQPAEVSALSKARQLRPQLESKVGVTISFFCAGSPSRRGILELLKLMGVSPGEVQAMRYRGNGWPGMFAVTLKGEAAASHFRTYKDSWHVVQRHRPFSTHLWPDGTGEAADISCGDPWYRESRDHEPGSSVVLVRTETGRRIVRGAVAAGYAELEPAAAWKLRQSQKNLIAKRGAIWGRVAVMRAFGLPAPRLKGFSLFRNWLQLPIKEKLRSTVGTARRIISRGYLRAAGGNGSREPASGDR